MYNIELCILKFYIITCHNLFIKYMYIYSASIVMRHYTLYMYNYDKV